MKAKRHAMRRVIVQDTPLPDRKYRADPITNDRTGWYVEYDIVGARAVGSMYRPLGELCRRNFNVKVENRHFFVDIGTGSGVKIEFQHRSIPRS